MDGDSWGRTVERGGPSHALQFVPIFSTRRGHLRLLMRIFAGPSFTAGKCFAFLYPLLKHCQEPRSGVFHGFGLAPVHVLSSIASCHGPTMQQKDAQNHEQVTRKHG
jgi:hypothetical protein